MDRPVSNIGFGCASLGSRVGARTGLAALERAYARGVRWYDVAPSYGDGEAEALLGTFARGKRHEIGICTKVGIRAPRPSLAGRLARPALRTLVRLAPGARRALARRGAAVRRPALTGAEIEASLAASLRALGTDHVEALALHEPTLEDIGREDVARALDAVVAKGMARTIAIAGAPEVASAAVDHLGQRIGIVQIPDGPFLPGLPALRARIGPRVAVITHSVFGAAGALARLATRLRDDRTLARAFAEAGWDGAPRAAAVRYLLDYALASNQDGIVLLSMFDAAHLAFNLDEARSSAAHVMAFAATLRAA